MRKLMVIGAILCIVSGCMRKPEATIEEALHEKSIAIVEDVIQGDFQSVINQGSLSLRYQVTPEYLEEVLTTFPGNYGSFVDIDTCDVLIRQDFYFSSVYVNYENYKHLFQMIFDNNLKLNAIYLK